MNLPTLKIPEPNFTLPPQPHNHSWDTAENTAEMLELIRQTNIANDKQYKNNKTLLWATFIIAFLTLIVTVIGVVFTILNNA